MQISQFFLHAGIIVPVTVYIGLLYHLLYSTFSIDRISPTKLTWSVPQEKRNELIVARSEPLLAYKYVDIIDVIFQLFKIVIS